MKNFLFFVTFISSFSYSQCDTIVNIFSTDNEYTLNLTIEFKDSVDTGYLLIKYCNNYSEIIESPFNKELLIPNQQCISSIELKDALTCIDTVYKIINIKDDLIFYVPNTFTPDGDEFNNIFKPIFTSGIDQNSFELTIYNRWVEVIYESNDINIGWDGTYNGYIVQDGTYVWKISFKTNINDDRKIYNGHVNVIK